MAKDGDYQNYFGCSISVDGDTALVGAKQEDQGGSNAGSAYVFVRSGTTWNEQQKLIAPDAEAYELFGFSVSISVHTALIGACRDGDNGTDAGSAYVYDL